MNDDFMEIAGLGLVPTTYGFIDKETGEKFDHDGNPLGEIDDETSKDS